MPLPERQPVPTIDSYASRAWHNPAMQEPPKSTEQSDWRLGGQDHLIGLALVRRRWTQTRSNCDHDHCEFCWAKFGDADSADVHYGWTTPDE
jgi:hypothetical protein